jgi:sugar/nucleoside kinase (ribokinase family)
VADGILVLGNAVFDLVVRPVEELKFDATVWVESLEESLGGNGAITAYTAGLLGVPVRLMAYVGKDAAGEFVLGELARAGVDTSLMIRAEAPTAATAAVVNAAGARALLHRPGVSREAFPEPPKFSPQATEGCAWFHLANPYGLSQVRRHAGEILRRARAAGLKTAIDTGWDSHGEWMKVLEPCLACCDLLFVNQDEAFHLSGRPEVASAARRFREEGAGRVVVKLGGAGCAVFGEEGEFRSPALPVEVVDTTGAGDAFVGGFLAALARGLGWPEAARVANACGALSVSRLGGVAGLRSWEETRAWMERAAEPRPGEAG